MRTRLLKLLLLWFQVVLYKGNTGHQEVLRTEGKCGVYDPVPLVLVKDIMTYMPQMKYMFRWTTIFKTCSCNSFRQLHILLQLSNNQSLFQQYDGRGRTCRKKAEGGLSLKCHPSIEQVCKRSGEAVEDNLKVTRREDMLPKTSAGKLLATLSSGNLNRWVQQKTRKFKLSPLLGIKCCGYQIKLATIPVRDMQQGSPLSLHFQYPKHHSLCWLGASVAGLLYFWVQRCCISKIAYLYSSARHQLSTKPCTTKCTQLLKPSACVT